MKPLRAYPGSAGRFLAAVFLLLHLAAAGALAATPGISAKRQHALALGENGTVYAWGSDTYGQLGTGRALYRTSPTVVAGIPSMTAVAAGTNHVVALDTAGNVWTWGGNVFGQLGQREEANDATPGRVLGIAGVSAVSAGQTFSVALKSDGTVWVWGSLAGVGEYSAVARQVSGLSGITKIAAGDGHLLALKGDGTVWAMGQDWAGQLGDGTASLEGSATPSPVPGVAGATAIAAGYTSSLAIVAGGAVMAWGSHTGPASARLTAQPVAGLSGVKAIASFFYSHAVRADGTVVRWDDGYSPVPFGSFSGLEKLSAGAGSLYGLDAAGALFVVGGNAVGQLGIGSTTSVGSATQVPGITNLTHLSGGGQFAAARRADGAILVWGSNAQGQMANGDIISRSVPQVVQGLPAGIVAVQAGTEFSLALDDTGQVWGWGNNDTGQVGGQSGTPRSLPQVISSLSGIVQMAAGCNHALFRKNDNTVWATGFVGSTGGGTQVAGLSGITGIGSGCGAAFAIRGSDGALFSWGWNFRGQLGDGTTTNRDTPVQVTAIDVPVTSVDLQQDHGIARTSDGTVWTWGANDFGQLGDGTKTSRPTPARVSGLAGVADVAAGFTHSLARMADGTVRAWGWNAGGQVGDGTTVQERLSPVVVTGLDGVTHIAAAQSLSFAVRAGGTAWGWGADFNATLPRGAVGDGTYAIRRSPVLVLREAAAGNLDTGNWYLDLAAAADNLPAGATKSIVPVANVYGSQYNVSLEAGINYRQSDYGKNVGVYVLGYVPPAFLTQVKTAPSLTKARIDALAKNGTPVFVQLTPLGWTTVTGQLVAYATGVINGNGSATNILDGVSPTTIPGARFCIGYGESPDDMLSSAALGEVLTLEGAASSASGLPCVLSGTYVSGPPASNLGSPVTFTATVVGTSPSGSVQLKDGPANLGSPLALESRNEAVASASLTTSSLAAGAHGIGAAYSGDSQNPASEAAIPLSHVVAAATSGTVTTIAGPASSTVGDTVVLTATVTGSAPTGTVQFKDGGANLGSPIALFLGTATLHATGLAPGSHAFSAHYAGDGGNAASASPTIAHEVLAAITTSVDIASSANPSAYGAPVTFTATVTGNAPTGSVTFRDWGVPLGSAGLTGGSASVQVGLLAPGVHYITADYSGDGTNPAASSATLFQQVEAPLGDTTPDAFSFAPVADAVPGATLTSGAVTVGGITLPAAVSVTGGQYSVGCTGTFTSAPGSVSNGQSVCVRHVAALAFGASTTTTLTIGGVAGTFTSTTLSLDPAADADGDGIPNGVELAEGRNLFVKDNDIFSPGAASARLFAMQMYRDFLGREGDAAGIQGWADAVAAGSWSRPQVIDGFLSSQEFAGFVAPVVRLYFATFLRVPDYDGLTFNAGLVRNGTLTPAQLADFFAGSPEFLATYGSLDNTQFVTLLYNNVLGRVPDPGGLSGWVALLQGGYSRGQVLLGFSESVEYQAALANEVFVTMMYAGMLRRTPEPLGFNGWVGFLDAGTYAREQVINGFFLSTEYRGRFLP